MAPGVLHPHREVMSSQRSSDPKRTRNCTPRRLDLCGVTIDETHARLDGIRVRIAEAAHRAGRNADEVCILPVTKGHPAESIELCAELGLGRFGENRVPEAEAKRGELGRPVGLDWHFIGRLQRNKARRAVRLFDVIESVDSLRLARTIDRIVREEERSPVRVLVQVNASREAVKAGFPSDEAVDAVAEMCELSGLDVEGLMTMAPFTDDADILRRTFSETTAVLSRCRDTIQGFKGRVLSMGMTNDFEIAVEEGSTQVRLGTILLGRRLTGMKR